METLRPVVDRIEKPKRSAAFRSQLRYSIRLRVLGCSVGALTAGVVLGRVTENMLDRLEYASLRGDARLVLILLLAVLYAAVLLAVLFPVIVRPLENLNQRLRGLKTRSRIRKLDPAEFADLRPVVEATQDFIEWAQNQQSLSAMIHHASRKRIEHLVEFDTLTGLYNRHFLQAILPANLTYAANLKDHLSLIMLDVDHFKHYNDRNGHPAGDEVLTRVADILRNSVREQDVCCRYGGEEFLIVLPNAHRERALAIAERIRNAIADSPFPHEEHQPNGRISASLGLATFPDDAKTPEELIECADQSMYLSKRRGRNRTSSFEDVIADTGNSLQNVDSAG